MVRLKKTVILTTKNTGLAVLSYLIGFFLIGLITIVISLVTDNKKLLPGIYISETLFFFGLIMMLASVVGLWYISTYKGTTSFVGVLRLFSRSASLSGSDMPSRTSDSNLTRSNSNLTPKLTETTSKTKISKNVKSKKFHSSELKELIKKNPVFPVKKAERMDFYRRIARKIQNNQQSFTMSQVLRTFEEFYSDDVMEDRLKYLNEIDSWLNEDSYVSVVKTEQSISYFKVI